MAIQYPSLSAANSPIPLAGETKKGLKVLLFISLPDLLVKCLTWAEQRGVHFARGTLSLQHSQVRVQGHRVWVAVALLCDREGLGQCQPSHNSARCSAAHKHQHPSPSPHPWPTPHCLASCSAFAQVPSVSVQATRPSTRALQLQHRLQKSLTSFPALLVRVFCSVGLNYCPRLKSLGLVMSK